MKRFSRNGAFLRNVGEWAEWDCKVPFQLNSYAEIEIIQFEGTG
ncbi:hypothetical protein [Zunongwangia profunda]|nr:hypothetical protein [Zunongwangia profunda]